MKSISTWTYQGGMNPLWKMLLGTLLIYSLNKHSVSFLVLQGNSSAMSYFMKTSIWVRRNDVTDKHQSYRLNIHIPTSVQSDEFLSAIRPFRIY